MLYNLKLLYIILNIMQQVGSQTFDNILANLLDDAAFRWISWAHEYNIGSCIDSMLGV